MLTIDYFFLKKELSLFSKHTGKTSNKTPNKQKRTTVSPFVSTSKNKPILSIGMLHLGKEFVFYLLLRIYFIFIYIDECVSVCGCRHVSTGV